MKKSFGTKMKVWALGALTVIVGSTFNSCTDEIPEENRFTFTGELIADHLKKDQEKYGHFCTILEKAKISDRASSLLTTLSTYGSYTCFAPTNDAIEQYLKDKCEEYEASIEANKKDPNVKIINTGITSPELEDLSDSMATVIAKNHLIEKAFTTVEVNGQFPKKTMSRRTVSFTWDTINGATEKVINDIIVEEDNIETENGYIHRIKGIISPSDLKTSELLAIQPQFKLFNEALVLTGLYERLETVELDSEYTGLGMYGPGFSTEGRVETPPYPEAKNQGFTLLVETDELFANPDNNSLGKSIQSINDLIEFAEHWYGTEERGNYTNPKNALYKFIAYHIIDRELAYEAANGPGGFIMEKFQSTTKDPQGNTIKDEGAFDSEENLGGSEYDRYDYFETVLPYTSIKITKPLKTGIEERERPGGEKKSIQNDIIVNYAQEMGARCVIPGMEKHINVIVEDVNTTRNRHEDLKNFKNDAANGQIYTIDRILIYNEKEMAGNVLDERMRWDIFSLFPELTNNGVRWCPRENGYALIYIPPGYCSRLKHRNTSTDIYYLRPYNVGLGSGKGGYANYQGDEMLAKGKYDFEYRIPYVPTGRYEIRFGFSCSDVRGVAQFYFDDKICGIPLDMRNSNIEFMGWYEESESEDENRKKDKQMRNRGFMKAPASVFGKYGEELNNLRHAKSAMRRILGTYELTPGKDYWLRFKDVTEASSTAQNEFNQDYLEIVPVGIINNAGKPEDTN